MMQVPRRALGLVLGVTFLACADPAGHPGPSATQTIVLVTVDGLIPERVRAFGGDLAAPHLEELVGMSTVWRDAWTTVPMARPAVATYLTGLAPDRHGVRDDLFTPLSEDVPTLATLLSAAGYRTAAFPGSSQLGWSSGLLRAFEVVDDPPMIPISAERWTPVVPDAEETAGHVKDWLGSLPDDARSFTWVHLAYPLRQQLLEQPEKGLMWKPGRERKKEIPEEATYRAALERVDQVIGSLLDGLRSKGWLERSLVILAGTQSDQHGGAQEPMGSGYSLDPRAVRVPLAVHLPSGRTVARAPTAAVWAPDVPATIAALGGIELAESAEGQSLLDPADPARILVSWSWATWDQMRWPVLRVARQGEAARYEGLDGARTVAASAEVEAALTEALAGRRELDPPRVDVDAVRPVLERRGLELEPRSSARPPAKAEDRVEVVRRLWGGRRTAALQIKRATWTWFDKALEIDPDNLAVLLDMGQTLTLLGWEGNTEALGHAAALYPDAPEVIHWYAHAIWNDNLDDAEVLLNAVLPAAPVDGDLRYDLACVRSLNDDLPAAEEHLRAAIQAGFRHWEAMESDPDLRLLRESERYAEVLKEFNR